MISLIPTIKPTTINKENIFKENIFYDYSMKNVFDSKTFSDVFETLNYLMETYGKCIYVKIINNKLVNFLPFKNPNYIGSWQVHIDKMGFKHGYIFLDEMTGLLDNYIIKNYDDIQDISWIEILLNNLCERRTIGDCEFFINYARDLPVITKNGSCADFNVFGENTRDFNMPELQHTVLSFNTSEKFKDIPMPTFPDFQRIIKNQFGIENFRSMKWEDKVTEFLFRGNSLNKTRLDLVRKLKDNPLANVGITEFLDHVPHVKNFDISYLKEDKTLYPTKDFNILSRSKFIFLVDEIGHPKELSMILFSGSCILRVKSQWKAWFDPFLTHYISIEEDLSDLEEKIQWCLDNDDKCKQMGMEARSFAIKYLSTNGIYDYLEKIISEIKLVKYPPTPKSDIEMELKLDFIRNYFQEKFFSTNYDLSLLKKKDYSSNKVLSMLQIKSKGKQYIDFKQGLHAAFVGLVLNDLSREIPNFAYTYYCYSQNDKFVVCSEFIENGMNLTTFLKKYPGTEVFIQLYLSLQLAWERYCFIHGRLDPYKLFVQILDKPRKIVYRLMDQTWAINTKYLLTITDYSFSTILTTCNKTQRMFFNNSDTFEKMLHGDRDIKYLMKKLGRDFKDGNDPLEILKRNLNPKEIKERKIKFGKIEDEPLEEINPRYLYDKVVKQDEPEERVLQRIFINELPEEKTSVGNAILQYEISQTLQSTIANMNLKVNVNLVTSEKFKKFKQHIKKHYDHLIEKTSRNKVDIEDKYSMRVFLRRYMFFLKHHELAKHFKDTLKEIGKASLKDSIDLGLKNTFKFYGKYK